MPIFNITPSEAQAQQDAGATLVDVRSTREFAAGHPAGALNIPLNEHDEETGQMAPNPDFMRVMQATVPTDRPVILTCQSGGRSLRAARMMESFGYTHVSNLLGGFKGKTDPVDGRTIDPGWHASGLPVDGLADHLGSALVGRDGAKIVASAALELYGDAALLRSVAVAPSHRGRGLGERITRAALDLAEARGVRTVYLLTTTAADFFARRLGFAMTTRAAVPGRVRASLEFTALCPDAAQPMVRSIGIAPC